MSDSDTARLSGTLANGNRYTLTATRLTITSSAAHLVADVFLSDVTAVQRGGTDVSLTRRAADPVTVTLATLDAAARLTVTLRELLADGRSDRRQRRWR